ncbi:transport and Golgi organization protein 1 homolog isoform 2-T2 [Pholidichthys leucotaenia]
MAAKHFNRRSFILLLLYFLAVPALERRFSDFKRCADEECSMLLCRGKAVQDFSGPDCRFLSFKKSETVYVYYKLSGRRADMWAGSVGSHFGYFPKDFLAVNHVYTEKEYEVPAEETDFVCFDTGFDKFDNYNIDLLLGSPLWENGGKDKEPSDQIQTAEDLHKETQSLEEEESESEKLTKHHDISEDLYNISEDTSASLSELDTATESPSAKVEESGTAAAPGTAVRASEEETEQKHPSDSILKNVSEARETKDTATESEVEPSPEEDSVLQKELESVSEGVQVPKLKTTLGTTFDAIITNDEVTNKVTPPYEEKDKDIEDHPKDDKDVKDETKLLSYSKENLNTPDSLKGLDSPPTTADDKPMMAEEKNMWTSLGDAVFSTVTGVEMTEQEISSEEDDNEVQIQKINTTLGSTFDAVVTDDKVTTHVTPYEEEDKEDVEIHPQDPVNVKEGTPLLSFSEESLDPGVSRSSEGPELPSVTQDEKSETAMEKKVLTLLGDGVVSAVTGVEKTEQEMSLEEDEDDDKLETPKLETTFGTTFDAVVTDDDITSHVTPHEKEAKVVEEHPKDSVTGKEETPLLSFSEESMDTKISNSSKVSSTTQDKKSKASEEKNMWASFGDAVFSAVTGVEIKGNDLTSEEDDDDDHEEEPVEKTQRSLEEIKKEQPLQESPKDPEATDMPVVPDFSNSRLVGLDVKEHFSEELSFDLDDKSNEEVIEQEAADTTVKPTEGPTHKESLILVDPVSHEDILDNLKAESSAIQTPHEPPVDKTDDQDSVVTEEEGTNDENTNTEQELHNNKSETYQVLSTEEMQSNESDGKNAIEDSITLQKSDPSITDLKSNNIQAELSVEDTGIFKEPHTGEMEHESNSDMGMENGEEKEELLEDENALSFSQSEKLSLETSAPSETSPEPEYSDSILRLTLLREHFTEEKMLKIQKLLGLNNLYKVEAMFSDLDTEFQATRQSLTGATHDIENALEGILEASENTILDEIEKMLDSQNTKHDYDLHADTSSLDEETEMLDDFQELAFSLRQKYSAASDSTSLATENSFNVQQDEHSLDVKEDSAHVVEENSNHTVAYPEKSPAEVEEEHMVLDAVPSGPDVSMENDGTRLNNKNEDIQPGFSTSDRMQDVRESTMEEPTETGLDVEVEHPLSESGNLVEAVTKLHEEEMGLLSTGIVYIGCILSMMKNRTAEWIPVMISLLPEEWKPGETLFGCPWQAVLITALVGVVTFTVFFWRTVLAVKKKEYLVDEKRLSEQIQAHKKEKAEALAKMAELQKQTEELKKNQNQSKETVSTAMKKVQNLENTVLEAEMRNKQLLEEKNKYANFLVEEKESTLQNKARIDKLEKSNEKLQLSRKKIQEALAKTTLLLNEAKIREDARNVQQKCLEREFSALKEENKTLKVTIKDWEDKHKEMNEQIKVYQKSQKELEDSVVLKDHNVEVLSELLADLDACDLQKSDSSVLANGEVASVSVTEKKAAIKNRIKQMMDISRVQTTLTVVEEERDRFMTKLLNEEKSRKALEEKHQELEHSIATLKSEKSHVENQFKILQQKNEIMVEMYQQKENALQQKLTKEELERRSKENLLSEVGGKALEAEEQVKVLRQRINEMDEQMKKTAEVYKEQIKEQENKTHSNWVNARNAERALNQEKAESSKLREKLAMLMSQLNERRAPLFRPNSGQPSGPRQGDSYGPSPVSGGAPSPPIMIEGPKRPPSAPVGRRIDPYGPRPPSDPHSRYAENKHMSGMDMTGPRNSSPNNLDGPVSLLSFLCITILPFICRLGTPTNLPVVYVLALKQTQTVDPQIKAEAEASTESPEAGPGSFITSPVRDSPGPMVHGPPPVPGPHDPMLPPGRLPPPIPFRPPRSGPYQLPPGPLPPNVPPNFHGLPLPANGHPGMPLPGPLGGEFGPRPTNGLPLHPRPGPGSIIDPRGPPPPHFCPPPPHLYGPLPPPQGLRETMGPRPPIFPDMCYPVPPHPAHPGDAYGQPAPSALQNSAGAHSGPGQDMHTTQEAPQDSARPAVVKP